MIQLLLMIVLVVLACGAAIWIIGQLVPNHPAIIDRGIWVLCVVVIILLLVNAFGILDIPVPRVR